MTAAVTPEAQVVVIDDCGLGFRSKSASHCWPDFLSGANADQLPAWILLRMSRPYAYNDLWKSLVAQYAERLVVVVTADDLRREGLRVTPGMSWERTIDDTLTELRNSRSARGLQSCRCLVVTFRGDAAIGLESRHTDVRRHFELLQHLSRSRIYSP